ncbi:MAG TPA: glycosyltransferase [Vicinamibacterales bacterium]
MPTRWHILTGEYPPASGGVGDYTAQLAEALSAAADTVTVWVPGQTLPDRFGRESRRVLADTLGRAPGIVLLQYVPNALGARGMNLAFCRWLRACGRDGMDVRVMFHEPYFYFGFARPWRNALAAVQRIMARTLLDASKTAYISTETWRRYLTPRNGLPLQVLPIPSNVPGATTPEDVDRFRHMAAPGGEPVIGHFGTYGDHVERELIRVVRAIAEQSAAVRFALIGAGSTEFLIRFGRSHPRVASRCWASGRLDACAVPSALKAADVLVQPYPEGVTTRRTSVMAGLQHGLPIVTTAGALTEPVWAESGAVRLASARDPASFVKVVATLLRDRQAAAALGRCGAEIYDRYFSLRRTLEILRRASPAAL